MTPESLQELQRLLLTKRPKNLDVGSITPLTPYEAEQLNRQQLSSDPVIRKFQKLGRGIKGLLVPETTLDTILMGAVPLKAASTAAKTIAPNLQRAKDMGFRVEKPVYHGTHAGKLEKFDDSFIGQRDEGFFGRGHYFADSAGEASYYGPDVGKYFTRGKLLDLTPTKKNSDFELYDKKYFKFWTEELDKLDMLDEPTKKGLKTINKIDEYVDKNVKFIKSSDNRGNEGISAYIKHPAKKDSLNRIFSYGGMPDKKTAIKNLKNEIIDQTRYDSELRKLYPDTENILYDLSQYIRFGYKGADELTKQVKKAGYDGIRVGDETVIFDPKNIRSVEAKFDPKKSSSPNLLAGIGGLSLLATGQQENK